jgi:hypothetical protein
MLEFSSISVSTYDSASLAERLTERSAEGWDVVSIVQTGTTVTAFISRPAGGTSPVVVPEVVEATTFTGSYNSQPESSQETTSVAAVSEGSGHTTTATETVAATQTSTDTDTIADSIAATGASAETTGNAVAPAGWYADPAHRFELRYWDGDKWTEYVSRGGQQFTDPPVA